ncbi:MAG: hypothetical protein MUF54_25735, partial [Polyangiaceae bacterium]|nr:hypothetical protein [Polyangiaceae bacterium]
MRKISRRTAAALCRRELAPAPVRFLLATLACLFLALCSAACVSKPTMAVQYAQVSGVGPMGIGVNVVVKVHNGNSFDIMVRQVRAKTVIADQFVLPEVQASPNVWLPAGRSTLVATPVVIPWPLVPPILATSLGNEFVSYHVQGSADVSATRTLG